jgi:hypothetical protein
VLLNARSKLKEKFWPAAFGLNFVFILELKILNKNFFGRNRFIKSTPDSSLGHPIGPVHLGLRVAAPPHEARHGRVRLLGHRHGRNHAGRNQEAGHGQPQLVPGVDFTDLLFRTYFYIRITAKNYPKTVERYLSQ